MRVIAGEFRSRRLKTVPGQDVRPTSDRLRETLFNVLASRIEGTTFVDAYAGSGAVGIEALSRGAKKAIFLDRSRGAVLVIRENLRALGIADRAEVRQAKACSLLPTVLADAVFLDPPYPLEREYVEALGILAEGGCRLAIAQHASRYELAERYGALKRMRLLRQGDNCLSFYEPE